MQQYLEVTPYFNFDHPLVIKFCEQITEDSDIKKAVAIFYAVREQIRYNPYQVTSGVKSLTADYGLECGEGYCLSKAALMIAACRYYKIPARIGLADVRNHLASQRMLEWLGTDYFAMHGYCEVYLNHHWVKATPAFNASLCEKFGVAPLEFDGKQDAEFQLYTKDGRQHMTYEKYHGTYAEMPAEFIFNTIKAQYPNLNNYIKQPSQIDSLEADLLAEK